VAVVAEVSDEDLLPAYLEQLPEGKSVAFGIHDGRLNGCPDPDIEARGGETLERPAGRSDTEGNKRCKPVATSDAEGDERVRCMRVLGGGALMPRNPC
jgi:hypothetical protein